MRNFLVIISRLLAERISPVLRQGRFIWKSRAWQIVSMHLGKTDATVCSRKKKCFIFAR